MPSGSALCTRNRVQHRNTTTPQSALSSVGVRAAPDPYTEGTQCGGYTPSAAAVLESGA